ncbi:hypothetical protein EYR38_006624 [Pleurotus pulmonarius]|nr:hypothetical protein EYR38_006624 [Pleurotus pulmonarius]
MYATKPATVPPTPPPLQTPSKLLRDTCRRNVQLPSPISPSTREPPSPPSTPSPTSRKSDDNRIADTSASANTQHGLVPIKGFVHEVLRRSRTSACVLQTALCYLEAIRSKVPELVRQEALGEGIQGEPETQSRVISASDLDHAANCEYLQDSASMEQDVIPTVRVNDCGSFDTSVPDIQGLGKKVSPPVSPLPPMAPLPSPLLCPRRAFLASLILASKFTQDKCYSNRAWAKLSGLAPREIGSASISDAGDSNAWLWNEQTPMETTAPREIEDSVTQSPIPSTPPLTLSPSSTESSSGDRTIQMSFLDDVCSFCDSNNTPGSGPAWYVVGEAWSSVSFCPIHGANGLASLGFRKHDLPKPPPTVNDLSGLSKTIPMEITNEYTGIATLAPDISSL